MVYLPVYHFLLYTFIFIRFIVFAISCNTKTKATTALSRFISMITDEVYNMSLKN